MTTINTNDLRVQNANDLINVLTTRSDSYVTRGGVLPWPDENAPPPPQNNNKSYYSYWDSVYSLEPVRTVDAKIMLPRRVWESGIVYDRYQHNYTLENRSFNNASNIYDCNFFVLTQTLSVFVCLDNNNNSPSTVEPNAFGSESFFFTSDGYQWLRLYDISEDDLRARTTNTLMPLTSRNVNVTAKEGEIYTVLIDDAGTGYTNNPQGVNQLNHYYAKISGDGAGAVAKVTVSGGGITEVLVTRPGVGYSFAELIFESGKVYATENELDLGINGLNPLGNGNLRTTVIIPPPQGWGSNLARELGGTRVGIFSGLENIRFPGEFRQIGVLTNPTTKAGKTGNIIACSAIKVVPDSVPTGQLFVMGETIKQSRIMDGTTKNAKGTVVAFRDDIIYYVQGETNVDEVTGELIDFGGNTSVVGETSGISATVDRTETGTGVYDTLDFSSGYARGNATPYTGSLNFITNISPVAVNDDEQKRINLVISF